MSNSPEPRTTASRTQTPSTAATARRFVQWGGLLVLAGLALSPFPGFALLAGLFLFVAFVLACAALYLRVLDGRLRVVAAAVIVLALAGGVVAVIQADRMAGESLREELRNNSERSSVNPSPRASPTQPLATPATHGAGVATEDWRVTVSEYDRAGTQVGLDANNPPAPVGQHYEVATATIIYTGAGESTTDGVQFQIVPDGAYPLPQATGVEVPDALSTATLRTDEEASGTIVFLVPDDTERKLWITLPNGSESFLTL